MSDQQANRGLTSLKFIDDAVSDGSIDAVRKVFPPSRFEKLAQDQFPFYRTTFWYPLERTPSNVFEALIAELQSLVELPTSVVGVEWWFSVMYTNTTPQWLLPCHFDRSDLTASHSGHVTHPTIASVFYLNDAPYGELVVTDQTLTRRGRRPRQPSSMEFVMPVANRYVMFPGHLYHGVIGRMWRAKQPDVLRLSMAVNWWGERPSAPYLNDSSHCMAAFGLND